MSLSKEIILANGVNLKYHVLANAEIVSNNKIRLAIHSFISKDYYELAIKKNNLIKEQEALTIEFNDLNEKEKLTKTQQTKIENLVSKINELADEINKCNNYIDYIILENFIEIPIKDSFNKEDLEKELLKTDLFKSARIVK